MSVAGPSNPHPLGAQPDLSDNEVVWSLAAIVEQADWNADYALACQENRVGEMIYTYKIIRHSDTTGQDAVQRTVSVWYQLAMVNGNHRCGIPRNTIDDICKSIKSIVLCEKEDCQIEGAPNFALFLFKYQPDTFSYYLVDLGPIDDMVMDQPGTECILDIGTNKSNSRALVKRFCHLASTTLGLGMNASHQKSYEWERAIATFYLNCLLSIVPESIHTAIRAALEDQVRRGFVRIVSVSSEEYKNYHHVRVPLERVMACALIAGTAFTKQGATGQHIQKWITKRSQAMFGQAGRKQIPITQELQYEIPILADILGNRVALRRGLFAAIFDNTIPKGKSDPIYRSVKFQIMLLTQYYQMSTLHIAYNFVELCNCEVFTLPQVVEQAMTLIANYNRLKTSCVSKNIEYYHYCVLYPRDDWMEIRNYSDIAYSAILWHKAMGNKSWANYKLKDGMSTSYSKVVLVDKTSRALEKIAADVVDKDVV